jgi:hypothetical protein
LLVPAAIVAGCVAGVGAAGGVDSIRVPDIKAWLTYIASDELQGRATYSTGIGLAASYISDHLREWGLKPAGDKGSYLQTVYVRGVRTTSRSNVTVRVGSESRTFRDGDGVTFPRNMGGKQRLVVDRVAFAGYGLDVPALRHHDYDAIDVQGAGVVWLGARGPKAITAEQRRLLTGRSRYAIDRRQAVAAIGVAAAPQGAARGQGPGGNATPPAEGTPAAAPGRAGGANQVPNPDFTTTQRLDTVVAPSITAGDAFYEFLFSRAPTPYPELKRLAAAQEPLPTFRLDDVSLTFDVDAEYEVVRTRLAHNVVAVVEGSDPRLAGSYVAFGAHYDHVGYSEGELTSDTNGQRRPASPGGITKGAEQDRVWNGADDDGSGVTALMALARAFAEGPRTKRSLLFVWHTGEESGLLGSRYFADHPTVPLDRIAAQLNVDMIGRNKNDDPKEARTVYPVGSDRISTELDDILRAANLASREPLTLDYALNDPSDLEQIYYRSDHYSYAAKGIPIIFFTTNLHPDYHTNTDEVSKIEFEKLVRVTRLIYEVGRRVGNLDHSPVRDNLGPRSHLRSRSLETR